MRPIHPDLLDGVEVDLHSCRGRIIYMRCGLLELPSQSVTIDNGVSESWTFQLGVPRVSVEAAIVAHDEGSQCALGILRWSSDHDSPMTGQPSRLEFKGETVGCDLAAFACMDSSVVDSLADANSIESVSEQIKSTDYHAALMTNPVPIAVWKAGSGDGTFDILHGFGGDSATCALVIDFRVLAMNLDPLRERDPEPIFRRFNPDEWRNTLGW